MASLISRALQRIAALVWPWPRLAGTWPFVSRLVSRGAVSDDMKQQAAEGQAPPSPPPTVDSARTPEQRPPYCGPTRILVDVKDNGVYSFQQAWDTPQQVITRVLTFLGYDGLISPDDAYDGADCRFMAVDRWDQRIFMLFDLYNTDYSFDDAHREGNNELPVIVVRISHDKIKSKKIPQQIGMVDTSLRELHDHNGWEQRPPYRVDHANGAYPTYCDTRSLRPRG